MKKVSIRFLSIVVLMTSMGFIGVGDIEIPDNGCADTTGDIPLDEETYQAYLQPVKMGARDTLPYAYDARSAGIVTPPKNQGSCGSCWAFASVGALESHLLDAGYALPYDLSEQQQVSCNLNQSGCCSGSASSLRFWENQGPIYESCFPYGESGTICSVSERTIPCSNSASCSQIDYRVTNFHTVSANEFRESVWVDGPSYFRFNVYSDFYTFWNNASSGAVYTNQGGTYQGGHAVLIIGWSDAKQAYLAKNSWGATSGPQSDGTFWIAYSGHANNLYLQMSNFDIFIPTIPDDNYEENDTMAEAYVFEEIQWLYNVNGFGLQLDYDWYRINVREGYEDLSILAYFTHADGDIDIELYDASGNFLVGSYTSNDEESIELVVSGGGAYYLLVYGENAGNTYNLWWRGFQTPSPDDAYEENDSMAAAYQLPESTWLTELFGFGIQADEDWYRIDVREGYEDLAILAEYIHSEGEIHIQLIDSNGDTLVGSTSIEDNEEIYFVVPESGTYYIRVYFGNAGNSYDLYWVGYFSDDDYEENDTMQTAYPLGESVWLSELSGFGYQADEDWYRIDVREGYEDLAILAEFTHSEGDIDIELIDSNGDTLVGSTSIEDNEEIYFVVPESGTYYIRVYYGNAGNSYDLYWEGLLPDDNYEENDSMETAYSFVESTSLFEISGYGIQADEDWYRIDVREGYENLTIFAEFTHSEGDIDIQLIDSYGTSLDGSYSIIDYEYIDYVVPESGTYYILVYYGNAGNTYNLWWRGSQTNATDDDYEENDTMQTAFYLGESVWLSELSGFGYQADEDWYRINVRGGNEAVEIFAIFTHDEGDIDIFLVDSYGFPLDWSTSITDNEYIEYVVPEAGSYYIRVHFGNNGNRYDLFWEGSGRQIFLPVILR